MTSTSPMAAPAPADPRRFSRPSQDLKVLLICDTGCGCSMGNKRGQFVKGSLKASKASVQGAGGTMTTNEKGDFRFPMPSWRHGIVAFDESDSIYNPACAFALAAIGKASAERGVKLEMPGWGADGYFEYINGVRVTVLNRQVLIVRPIGYKESPALVINETTPESLTSVPKREKAR